METRETTIILNSGRYVGTDYHINEVVVTITKETEKAYQFTRSVKSKDKDYSVWAPKRGFSTCPAGLSMEKWFEKKLDGFDHWFYTAK